MNITLVVCAIISGICVIVTTVVAWVALKQTSRVAVSFTGTPVDKKDFEQHLREYKDNNFMVWQKMEKDSDKHEQRVANIEAGVASVEAKMDMLIQFLNKK
jgi:hypothetical protein